MLEINIDKIANICGALIDITKIECSNYGYDEEIGDATQFLNDYNYMRNTENYKDYANSYSVYNGVKFNIRRD